MMPKERIHWRIAINALNKIKDNSKIKTLLINNYYSYLLGSVSHDSLFYLNNISTYKKEISESKNFCHDGDTLSFFNRYKGESEAGLAFLFGALSHYCADTTFHPFIFHFTGSKYFNTDYSERHLKLETTLDQLGDIIFGNLKHLGNNIKINTSIYSAFNTLHYPDTDNRNLAKKALETHLSIYKLLNISSLSNFFNGAKKFSFYPSKPNFDIDKASQIWYNSHTYLQPVLGDDLNDSFDSLFNKSQYKFLNYVEQLEQLYPNFKIAEQGQLLDSGLVDKSQKDMTYFNLSDGEKLFTC